MQEKKLQVKEREMFDQWNSENNCRLLEAGADLLEAWTCGIINYSLSVHMINYFYHIKSMRTENHF